MGCNCKTRQKIINIHKLYGVKKNAPWIEKFNFRTENIFMYLVIVLMLIIFSPLLLIVVFILLFIGKGNIDISKVVNTILRR